MEINRITDLHNMVYRLSSHDLRAALELYTTDINTMDAINSTPLNIAVWQRDIDKMLLLLSYGADLNFCGSSLLHTAMKAGNAKILQILLDHRYDLNPSLLWDRYNLMRYLTHHDKERVLAFEEIIFKGDILLTPGTAMEKRY